MKRTALFAALLMLASTSALAQETAASPAPTHQEDRWPGQKTVGVRAGFGGSTATPGIDVGNVGLKVLLTDNLALKADLGLGIVAASNSSNANFALDVGLDIYLGDAHRSLRPYIPVFVGLGVISNSGINVNGTNVGGSSNFVMALGGGFGAEYFFAKEFSVSADLMFAVDFAHFDPFVVQLGTVTPGVAATYYF